MSATTPEPVRLAFFRVLDWIEAERLPYCVMGGFAFQVHGLARATFDVDLCVAVERKDLVPLLRRLARRGASVDEPYLRGWMDTLAGMRKVSFLVPTKERPIVVDLFVVTTPQQRSALRRRRSVTLSGRSFPVVSIEDLILLKLIAGRRKDDADTVDLLAFGGAVDVDYVRRWARRLRVATRLRRLAREAGRTELA